MTTPTIPTRRSCYYRGIASGLFLAVTYKCVLTGSLIYAAIAIFVVFSMRSAALKGTDGS